MSDAPKQSKFTGRRLVAASLGVLLVLGFLSFRPLQIAYHRWQVERRMAHLFSGKSVNGVGKLLWVDEYGGDPAHFEPHLRRLVELKAIRYKKYELQHVKTGTGAEECRHLFRSTSRLPTICCQSDFADPLRAMVLYVYNEWPDSAAWDEFIATHDVPDYRERFMEPAVEEVQP